MRVSRNLLWLIALLGLVALGATSAQAFRANSRRPYLTPMLSMAGMWPGMTSERVRRIHGRPRGTADAWRYGYFTVKFENTGGGLLVGDINGPRLTCNGDLAVNLGDSIGKVRTDVRQTGMGVARWYPARNRADGTLVWTVNQAEAVFTVRELHIAAICLQNRRATGFQHTCAIAHGAL